jgi:aryl-alcohol dehydrogenase-like predicted oxidoreductase
MMHRVSLPRTNLELSRLSFGTASLHHVATSRRRQDLLAAAFEQGFTHFDTAPSYGLGVAEQELGRFLKARRARATIATKVGLYAPDGSHPNTIAVWTRKTMGKVFPALSRPVVDWSIAAAKNSLELSLRRLSVDHIDLLLLHEPVGAAIDSDAFLEWLHLEQRKGRIRAWGLAGDVDRMRPWLPAHPLGMVLQVRDSLDRRDADLLVSHGRDLQISYGYLSSRRALPEVLNVTETLQGALQRNATGSIIVSTRRVPRIVALAAVVAEKDDGNGH